ncbi:TRIC cation channel family protein, partial [Rhodovulum sp.]|uniref:TRIC cation channel family protein n=1 Tax=Rhodovulum sp. TaxID=34009 RepID=UPI0032E38C7D
MRSTPGLLRRCTVRRNRWLAVSRKQLDIIGFLFPGAVTGIGGGTLRDPVLGVPVFWVQQNLYRVVCAAT